MYLDQSFDHWGLAFFLLVSFVKFRCSRECTISTVGVPTGSFLRSRQHVRCDQFVRDQQHRTKIN